MAVFAECLQQAIPLFSLGGAVAGMGLVDRRCGVAALHQRLVDQPEDQVKRVGRRDGRRSVVRSTAGARAGDVIRAPIGRRRGGRLVIVGAHRLGGREGEAAGEHGEAIEQRPLPRIEQVVAPIDGCS